MADKDFYEILGVQKNASDDEIERMVKEAEENAEADKKKRESVDTRNHADSLINETEKNLKEHGDKIPEADRNKITEDIEELKKVKDGEDLEAIKSKTEALVQSSLKTVSYTHLTLPTKRIV